MNRRAGHRVINQAQMQMQIKRALKRAHEADALAQPQDAIDIIAPIANRYAPRGMVVVGITFDHELKDTNLTFGRPNGGRIKVMVRDAE